MHSLLVMRQYMNSYGKKPWWSITLTMKNDILEIALILMGQSMIDSRGLSKVKHATNNSVEKLTMTRALLQFPSIHPLGPLCL